MAAIQERGVRVFSVAYVGTTLALVRNSHDELENMVNEFLNGDGSVDSPRKRFTSDPQLFVDTTNNMMFMTVSYERIN